MGKKQKVLVVIDEVWDSALTDLAIKIARVLEFDTACAVVKGSYAEKVCESIGKEIFFIENPRKRFPLIPFLSLKRVVDRFQPRVIIVIRGEETLFSAILKNKRKLIRIHGEAKGIKNSFLNKLVHKKVDGVILTSKKLENEVVKNIPKIYVNGAVDTEVFKFTEEGRSVRKWLGVSEREKLVGVVGRLDRVKGHSLFLKALSVAVKRVKGLKAVIVGEEKGVKLKELVKLSEELNVRDKVIFVPKRVEVVSFMSACDFGVAPSVHSEVIARVPLEFMACSKPVVLTNVGVFPEISKPPFCTISEAKPESLAEEIVKMANSDLENLGKLARNFVEKNYSLNALKTKLEVFLERIVGEKP